MRASGYNWMKTNVDTISGNRPHLLGCVFKCLLSLMPFFPHLSHRSPLSQFLMCLSVGIMKKKKTGFDNPLLLQSPNNELPLPSRLIFYGLAHSLCGFSPKPQQRPSSSCRWSLSLCFHTVHRVRLEVTTLPQKEYRPWAFDFEGRGRGHMGASRRSQGNCWTLASALSSQLVT